MQAKGACMGKQVVLGLTLSNGVHMLHASLMGCFG